MRSFLTTLSDRGGARAGRHHIGGTDPAQPWPVDECTQKAGPGHQSWPGGSSLPYLLWEGDKPPGTTLMLPTPSPRDDSDATPPC